MNAYYENVNSTIYTDGARERELHVRRFGDGLISVICSIIALVTCSAAIKLEKTLFVFALFLAFFGVIGGIDSGALSMPFGILLCGAISFFEYTTLKSVFKPAVKK